MLYKSSYSSEFVYMVQFWENCVASRLLAVSRRFFLSQCFSSSLELWETALCDRHLAAGICLRRRTARANMKGRQARFVLARLFCSACGARYSVEIPKQCQQDLVRARASFAL